MYFQIYSALSITKILFHSSILNITCTHPPPNLLLPRHERVVRVYRKCMVRCRHDAGSRRPTGPDTTADWTGAIGACNYIPQRLSCLNCSCYRSIFKTVHLVKDFFQQLFRSSSITIPKSPVPYCTYRPLRCPYNCSRNFHPSHASKR